MEQTKICTKCGIEKILDDFSTDKRQKYGRRPECRECSRNGRRDYIHDYYVTNKDKTKEIKRNSKIRRLYGLEKEDYAEMVKSQDNKCAICKLEIEGNLCVDHCHTTGKVRGLLCKLCNLVVGNAKDDIQILQNGIEYLNKYNYVLGIANR